LVVRRTPARRTRHPRPRMASRHRGQVARCAGRHRPAGPGRRPGGAGRGRPGPAGLAVPAVACCGMAAAGVLAATAAHPPSALGHGAFSAPAQAAALVAFGAALMPVGARARSRSDRDRRLARVPFTLVDEIGCYFDSPAEPNNIQLEAWLPGRLDKRRLRAATAAVMAARPRARVRRAAHEPWDEAYAWVVPPRAERDPVIA